MGEYGPEQQGAIVDEWFAGSTTKPKKNNTNLQIKFPPMDDHDESPAVNPYYRYLRDNIRTGIA
jgi:hypothetical protein